jgi:RNA polymerase sigma-B factor
VAIFSERSIAGTANQTPASQLTLELRALQDAVDLARSLRTRPPAADHRDASAASVGSRRADEGELWFWHERYHRRRARSDRDALVAAYTPHVMKLARRFYRANEPLDDLEQVALEALVIALERFDPGRGLPFLAFANPTIIGTIKRHFRDLGWAMRVPRQVHAMATRVEEVQIWLHADFGRDPTRAEIADVLDVDGSTVEKVMLAARARQSEPIDLPGSEPVSSGQELVQLELQTALAQCRARLDADDQEIITWYFDEGLRQVDIAARLGCSQMHVSRQLRRILAAMRAMLE